MSKVQSSKCKIQNLLAQKQDVSTLSISELKNFFIAGLILIVFGVAARLVLEDLPNIEPITLTAILAGVIFRNKLAALVPLAVVGITDVIIGNTSILIFTWSAWLIIGFFGLILKRSKLTDFSFIFKFTGLGLAANLFFYLWTNFGVWLVGGLYPRTASGLIESYFMGLPFLEYQIFGNLIILPIASFGLVILKRQEVYQKISKFLKVVYANKN